MSFLYPAWFAALIIIPLITIAVITMRRNKAKVWAAFVSKKHQQELVTKTKPTRFWISYTTAMLGLICLIIAMCRPYAGKSVSREKINTRNILIAMDTSLSMLCEDIQPSRLDSGISFAVNLIESLPNDHIGIMAYAGSPNVITSLSIDHPSIIEELGHLGPSSAHIRGSNLTDALYEGINTLKRTGKQANALILITDGTDTLDEMEEIINVAKQSHVQIFTIGVATKAGGIIPINGEPHRDMNRNVVITKLEDKILRQLATATSGVYTNINTQPERAIAAAIQSMTNYEQTGREIQIPRELYQWFLAPGILLLIISAFMSARFKSSFTTLLTIGYLSTSTDSSAAETSWTDEISTRYVNRPAQIKAGYIALEKKKYPEALTHLTRAKQGTKGDERAKLSLAIGQAAYRMGEYDLAAEEYKQALITDQLEIQNISQYNLANTIFRQHTQEINVPEGQDLTTHLEDQIRTNKLNDLQLENMEKGLNNALAHYDHLLKIETQKKRAEPNRNTTKKVIEAIQEARKNIEQEEKSKQDPNSDSENKENPENEEEPENKENKQQGKEQQEKPQENKDGDQEGSEKGDKQDKENPNSEGEQAGKEKKGDRNNQDRSDHDPEPNDQPQDGETMTETPAKFNDKKEALDFLKKHSDTRKKPLKTGRGYFNRPAIDW